jgi:hypothetical protein
MIRTNYRDIRSAGSEGGHAVRSVRRQEREGEVQLVKKWATGESLPNSDAENWVKEKANGGLYVRRLDFLCGGYTDRQTIAHISTWEFWVECNLKNSRMHSRIRTTKSGLRI